MQLPEQSVLHLQYVVNWPAVTWSRIVAEVWLATCRVIAPTQTIRCKRVVMLNSHLKLLKGFLNLDPTKLLSLQQWSRNSIYLL